MAGKPQPNKSHRALLGVLFVACLAYVLALPYLRHVKAETARIERETLALQQAVKQRATDTRALDEARSAAAKAPADGRAQLQLAALLDAAGKREEAIERTRAAIRLMPDDPEPLLMLADEQMRARRFDSAMAAYQAVLVTRPSDPRALSGLGWLYVSFGWSLDAQRLLLPVVKAMPNEPRVRVPLALSYLQMNDTRSAERLMQEVWHLAPADSTLWSPIVDVFLKSNRPHEALPLAQRALSMKPGDLRMRAGLVEAYYEAHELPQAEYSARMLAADDPHNIAAHYYLALCAKQGGRPIDEVRELEAVRAQESDYKQTILLLGQAYLQVGRKVEGDALLHQWEEQEKRRKEDARLGYLLSTRPNDPEAHLARAKSYLTSGDPARAVFELRRTLVLAPGRADAKALLRQAIAEREKPAKP